MKDVAEQGYSLRDDGFFSQQPDGRNFGEEAAEGVLAAARDSYEERKIPFLAALLTAIAIDDQIGIEAASRLIRLAEELSWTQYILIAAVERKNIVEPPDIQVGKNTGSSSSSWAVTHELHNLWERSLISAKAEDAPGSSFRPTKWGIRDQELTFSGRTIFHCLNLAEIGALDIDRVWRLIVQDGSPPEGATGGPG